MFSPKHKSQGLNSSLIKSPVATPNRNFARQNSSLYIPKSKSFFSPVSTGRNKNQNASEFQLTLNESQVSDHKLSVYSGWVPVNVAEILSSIDGLPPRAKINSNGLAWIVTQDKLLLWNVSPHKMNVCHELHLPNDSIDQSDMVLVATREIENFEVSCLAITSEGSAVYWGCVSYPRSFVEVKILSGKGSCDLCVDLIAMADGFLVGWLSGTLTYLQISQGQLRQTTLKAQQGRLTNIGRRFSSIIFGSGQRSSLSMQMGSLKKLLPGDEVAGGWELFVLLENHLQKWIISSPPLSEKFVYEVQLDAYITAALDQHLGLECKSIALQDIQLNGSGLSILFATISCSEAKYGIAFLETSGTEPPTSASKIYMSDLESPLLRDSEVKTFRLLWPDRSSSSCFFYNSECVVCLKDDEERGVTSEVVNFNNIGAGCYQGFPLFLSNRGILVRVQESIVAANLSMAESLLKNKSFSSVKMPTMGIASAATLDELSQSQDALTRFKAIFISAMCNPCSTQQQNKTTSLLYELLSPASDGLSSSENLDSLVVRLSREMIDDHPSNDPRWAESKASDSPVISSSLILGHQLNDKLRAQEAFLSFLKSNGIWEKLGMFSLKDFEAPTCRILCENSEKLVAATAMKDLHGDWSDVVNLAMERCVLARKSSMVVNHGSLKPQDLFYKDVSRIQEIFDFLVEREKFVLGTSNVETSQEASRVVSGTSAIFRELLSKALLFRRSKVEFYQNSNDECDKRRSHPGFRLAAQWTSEASVVTPMTRHHSILHEEVIPLLTADVARLNSTFQDLFDITDLILDALSTVIDSIGESEKSRREDLLKKFDHMRSDLIFPFVKHKQFERALSLAEKYSNFELMVQICDTIQDECRLEEYMKRYDTLGFPEVVFDWYCRTGKRGKLFSPKVVSHPKMEMFMSRPENRFMSWLYDVHVKNYVSAHETLFQLAEAETASVCKKRTFFSSAKLYAMLAKSPHFDLEERLRVINNNLELISHQETLLQTKAILEYLAIDGFSASRPYSALELIDLHIGPCNEDATEYDFKKAFDLLKFCDVNNCNHSIKDVLVDILVKAILRDDWGFTLSVTDPVSSCKDTIFCKLVELILSEVFDVDATLPSIEELLEQRGMERFREDADLQCKLMVIYEHARRMTE